VGAEHPVDDLVTSTSAATLSQASARSAESPAPDSRLTALADADRRARGTCTGSSSDVPPTRCRRQRLPPCPPGGPECGRSSVSGATPTMPRNGRTGSCSRRSSPMVAMSPVTVQKVLTGSVPTCGPSRCGVVGDAGDGGQQIGQHVLGRDAVRGEERRRIPALVLQRALVAEGVDGEHVAGPHGGHPRIQPARQPPPADGVERCRDVQPDRQRAHGAASRGSTSVAKRVICSFAWT
jgi:hypothetical protein